MEFNLSDKIQEDLYIGEPEGKDKFNVEILRLEDVKEFIRLLKEELPKATICTYSEKIYKIHEIIDKLAGDKLI
ncbi:MAG: hypothetical protein KKD18_00425 [Nanoarchaeota archaeon]|nr:hypothetical protein [Nanoarchaeota archaeon]